MAPRPRRDPSNLPFFDIYNLLIILIGRFFIAFSKLGNTTYNIFHLALGISEEEALLIEHNLRDITPPMTLLDQIVAHKDLSLELSDYWNDIKKLIDEHIEFRNRIAHGQFFGLEKHNGHASFFRHLRICVEKRRAIRREYRIAIEEIDDRTVAVVGSMYHLVYWTSRAFLGWKTLSQPSLPYKL